MDTNNIELGNKFEALAKFLAVDINEIEIGYNDEEFTYNWQEYLVLTDEEADDKEDEYLENYIDECILYEIPQQYRFYFDRELFKRDARMDGRWNSLASYDSNENEETVDWVTYYIYRTN